MRTIKDFIDSSNNITPSFVYDGEYIYHKNYIVKIDDIIDCRIEDNKLQLRNKDGLLFCLNTFEMSSYDMEQTVKLINKISISDYDIKRFIHELNSSGKATLSPSNLDKLELYYNKAFCAKEKIGKNSGTAIRMFKKLKQNYGL